jgi:hypothetical protein
MRRKVLQDIANTLCDMLVGWRMGEDLETLAQLPDGTLTFDVLRGKVVHSTNGELALHVAGELAAWLEHRLETLNVPKGEILAARLTAQFATDRIKTNRKRIVSFDWKCEGSVETDEKVYVGHLKEKHQWHTRLSPNNALERTPGG